MHYPLRRSCGRITWTRHEMYSFFFFFFFFFKKRAAESEACCIWSRASPLLYSRSHVISRDRQRWNKLKDRRPLFSPTLFQFQTLTQAWLYAFSTSMRVSKLQRAKLDLFFYFSLSLFSFLISLNKWKGKRNGVLIEFFKKLVHFFYTVKITR